MHYFILNASKTDFFKKPQMLNQVTGTLWYFRKTWDSRDCDVIKWNVWEINSLLLCKILLCNTLLFFFRRRAGERLWDVWSTSYVENLEFGTPNWNRQWYKKSAQEKHAERNSLQRKRSLTRWSIYRSIKNLWEGWVLRQRNVPYWHIRNWRWTLHPSVLLYEQQIVSLSPSKPFCRSTLTIESVHSHLPIQ